MIKNIIFDLGNVLLGFQPADYLEKNGYTTEANNNLISNIFKSKEWELLDNGDITIPEAIEKISARSSLKKQEIASFFDLRIKILHPIGSSVNLLPRLKKRGFKLYFLSNFPDDIFDEVFNEYEFFRLFDGGIISARVNSSKPEKKIYNTLLEKYSLKAEECLFIDDNEPNVRAADSIGMTGIWFTNSVNLKKLIEKKLPPGSKI